MSTEPRSRAWIEVSADSLLRNYRRIQESVGGARLLPMVKADGYGLGSVRVAQTLAGEDPVGFGVASVTEAERLRASGIQKRVVIFTPLTPEDVQHAARSGFEVTVSSPTGLAAAIEYGARFHLEVDTGMGRAGWPIGLILRDAQDLRTTMVKSRLWTGIFTHFHSADEPGAPGVADQLARLSKVIEALDPPAEVERHVANSAASLRLETNDALGTAFVRPGIHLYGGRGAPDLPAPDPVVALRARVVAIREAVTGDTLGYGSTHTAQGLERWATLAIGYGDGFPRSLSNRGSVLISEQRVPIVGRISMDMTVANISGLEGVRVGDVATLIGRDGIEEITVDDVAWLAGTISYEVLTGLTTRLPRVWVQE